MPEQPVTYIEPISISTDKKDTSESITLSLTPQASESAPPPAQGTLPHTPPTKDSETPTLHPQVTHPSTPATQTPDAATFEDMSRDTLDKEEFISLSMLRSGRLAPAGL